MTANGSPWSFHFHVVAWLVVVAIAVTYLVAVRRPGYAVTGRQAWSFVGGLVALLLALTWPVADLATHWLLLALVLQRLVLMLAVPPLLLGGLPQPLVAALTRSAPVDATARFVDRPPVAVAIVTVIAVGTLTVAAVDAQASSPAVRAGLDLAVLAAGFVLWLPVLGRLPGVTRPSALGRAGYVIVQSIVPSFLAVVWIFARHPLYAAYAGHGRVLGLAPLTDQQVAGFVAKLGTIAVLWTVAFVAVTRATHPDGDDEPLTWADVERQFERVARRERRLGHGPVEPPAPPPDGDTDDEP
jgi:cytochrome c oxidase assembly factor CtaG